MLDRSLGNNNYDLWTAGLFCELLSSTLTRDTDDLRIKLYPYVDTTDQKTLLDFIDSSIEPPFSDKECVSMTEGIEGNLIGTKRPTQTYSDETLELLDSNVQKDRQTTVITITGSPSNGKFDNSKDGVPNKITEAIKDVKSKVGSSAKVTFYVAAYEGANFVQSDLPNYKLETAALSDYIEEQEISDKSQSVVFRDLINRLRQDGILCKNQSEYKP